MQSEPSSDACMIVSRHVRGFLHVLEKYIRLKKKKKGHHIHTKLELTKRIR